MYMAHIMAVRSAFGHEIREVVVPLSEAPARIAQLSRSYETVFNSRTFWSAREG